LAIDETKVFFGELINDRPDLGLTFDNHRGWFDMIDSDLDGGITKDEMFNYF
jgi:hypothetical protein